MYCKRPLIWILGGWILGEMVVSLLGVSLRRETNLDRRMTGESGLEVEVRGRISRTVQTKTGIQLRLTDNEVFCDQNIYTTHDLLMRDGSYGGTVLFASYNPGDIVEIRGELEAFPSSSNPGEFDTEGYYRSRGIDYILTCREIRLSKPGANRLLRFSGRIRDAMYQSLEAVTDNPEDYGLFLALVLGERWGLTEEISGLYQLGGISHLLAVSGLHLSLMGNGIWKLLRRLGVPLEVSAALAGLLLGAFVWFTGSTPSGIRALIMFLCMLAASVIGRTYDLLSALGLAGLLILWENPLMVGQESFQLSFGALAAIGLVCPAVTGWCRCRKGIPYAFLVVLSIQICTLPILVWHEYKVSLAGCVLNLAAVPLMTYALSSVYLASLTGLLWPGVGAGIAGTASLIFRFYRLCCEAVSKVPGISIITGRPRWFQVCGYLALGMLFLLWRRYRENREKRKTGREHPTHKEDRVGLVKRRILFVVGFYVLGIVMLHRIPAPEPTVTVLDVGQGDCTVVISPQGDACLIDGGSSTVNRVGAKRILPYLEYEGIRDIEMIFLTHGDQDHINGISEVLESREIEVFHIAVSRCLKDREDWDLLKGIAEKKGILWHLWERGDRMDWGEICFTCLYPFSDTIPATDNDGSLMLLMETVNFRGLLTGDAEEAEELAVLSRGITPVHWLKVAHHGSRYSTGEAFLKQIKPLYATISYGEGNRYGHPHKETLDRLEAYGSFMLSTPDWGAITIECGARLRVTGFCKSHGS